MTYFLSKLRAPGDAVRPGACYAAQNGENQRAQQNNSYSAHCIFRPNMFVAAEVLRAPLPLVAAGGLTFAGAEAHRCAPEDIF